MVNFKTFFLLISLFQVFVNANAQKIESFSYSECDDTCDYERIQRRISFLAYNKNTLDIGFGLISNCIGFFNPQTTFYKDTLRILYEDYKKTIYQNRQGETSEIVEIVDCVCFFNLEFKITEQKKRPKVILLNEEVMKYYPEKYKTYPIKFDLLDGDTINYQDKYGFRKGLWYWKGENGDYSKEYWNKDEMISGERMLYYDNGRLQSEFRQDTTGYKFGRKYYRNGNLSEAYIENGKERFIEKTIDGIMYSHSTVDSDIDLSIEYHENGNLGKIKHISGTVEYYESGSIKLRVFTPEFPDYIYKKYYYRTGEVLAVEYWSDKEMESKRWTDYFKKSGAKTTKDDLLLAGLDLSFLKE